MALEGAHRQFHPVMVYRDDGYGCHHSAPLQLSISGGMAKESWVLLLGRHTMDLLCQSNQ